MADYKIEAYEAIKRRSGGGTVHQIGLMVARALNEDDDEKNVRWVSDDEYKLTENYRDKITRNLDSLANNNFIFKHYTDKDGAPLTEDEVFSVNDEGKKIYHLKSSQYNISYFINEAQVQVNNENLLRLMGVSIFPFNKNVQYSCDEMRDENPTPKGRFGLLFINDYKRGVYLYVNHDERPLVFIFMRKKNNIEVQKEKALEILRNRKISSTRATLIFLENSSYDFLSVDAGAVVVEITKDKELHITNISNDILNIGTELFFYDHDKYIEMIKEEVSNKKPMKTTRELFEEGFFKGDTERALRLDEKTGNYAHFSPVYFEMLRYVVVINMGK